jgi:hypothetical protein
MQLRSLQKLTLIRPIAVLSSALSMFLLLLEDFEQ